MVDPALIGAAERPVHELILGDCRMRRSRPYPDFR
jgi:hypothetical protein